METFEKNMKNFKCPECTYSSCRRYDLKRHMSIHEGGLYKCIYSPECEYSTNALYDLKRHMNIHNVVNYDKTYDGPRINLTIHTTDNNSSYIKKILEKNNIQYNCNHIIHDILKFNDTKIKFGLPPFNPPNRDDYKYIKFEIPLIYSKKVHDLFYLEKKTHEVYYFKMPKLVSKKFNFHGKKTPVYPIYVVSYDRYSCYFNTVRHLEKMKVYYYLCIQKSQEANYRKMLNDHEFKYCKSIILSENTKDGSYKQRNKCMDHARITLQSDKCWILDDNINGWFYLNEGHSKITNGWAFYHIEKLIDNVKEPIAIFSHAYDSDVRINQINKPFRVNRKQYSSLLLDLNLLHKHGIRWRLKFNEDVDLTLQALSKNLYTLSINYIVASKPPTLGCKGGNTSIIYDKGNRFDEKYETLYNIWKGTFIEPFITNKIKHLDKRTHHLVKYSCITKKLGLQDVITPKKQFNKEKSVRTFGISSCTQQT